MPAPGIADEINSRDQSAQLQRRLKQLESRADASHASGALQQARSALQKANGPGEDPGAVARAHKIAEAALVLADRQLARRIVQVEWIDAQRRLGAIRERAEAQRRVLEALMRERAALAREGERP